jgi:hypothetical protein
VNLQGPRKATVHFLDAVTRRGVITNLDTNADLIRLEPTPESKAPVEDLLAVTLKTIFLMLPRGAAYPPKQGRQVTVLLVDGRGLEGCTPDYDPKRKAFTLFPSDDRGNIERIIIYTGAVKTLSFEDE